MLPYLTHSYSRLGFKARTEGGDYVLVGFLRESNEVDMVVYGETSQAAMPLDKAVQIADRLERIGAQYKCFQYKIVSKSGFDFDTSLFEARNIAFCDSDYLESLASENHIELFAHNENAYRQICKAFIRSSRVAAIQATGTGKSLIIAKLLTDNPDSRILVVAPSNYILSEIGKYLPAHNANHHRITYLRLAMMTPQDIAALKPQFIVLDEFHRCGAPEWGKGVEQLIATATDAKVLGTSATPIRYLDGARNMADELFDGNVAVNLSLAKSIVRHILPTPKYVSALYNFDSNYNALKSKINRNSKQNKKEHLAQLNAIKRRWEQSAGVPKILSKHMPSGDSKVLVFCKDIEHLESMRDTVCGWFAEAGFEKINLYTVHSDIDHEPIFREFEQTGDGLNILLCVDILNEGIHVKGVDAILMLRDTSSPVIYYQQMGRCLTANRKIAPVIFDLVNNFSNIKVNDLLKEYNTEYDALLNLSKSSAVLTEKFFVIDEVKDIFELYNALSNSIEQWEVRYAEALEFYNRHGHCRVPHNDNSLWQWLRSHRDGRRAGLVTEAQIKKLEAIGFSWNPLDEQWEKMFDTYRDYVKRYGQVTVQKREKTLWTWVAAQRVKAKKGTLSQERIDRLNELGFIWSVLDERWMAQFLRVKDIMQSGRFLKEDVSAKEWAYIQKRRWQRGKLPDWQNELIDSLNLGTEPDFQKQWNAMYAKMVDYYRLHNTSIIPDNYSDRKLLGWMRTQRVSYNQGKLTNYQIEKLEEINFVWNHFDKLWEAKFQQLKNVLETNVIPDKKLRMWCTLQRQNRRQLKLSQEKIDKLDSIGFKWVVTTNGAKYKDNNFINPTL